MLVFLQMKSIFDDSNKELLMFVGFQGPYVKKRENKDEGK